MLDCPLEIGARFDPRGCTKQKITGGSEASLSRPQESRVNYSLDRHGGAAARNLMRCRKAQLVGPRVRFAMALDWAEWLAARFEQARVKESER